MGAGDGLPAHELSAGIKEHQLALAVGNDASALDAELARCCLQAVHAGSNAREGEFGQDGKGGAGGGAIGGRDHDVGALEGNLLHLRQCHALCGSRGDEVEVRIGFGRGSSGKAECQGETEEKMFHIYGFTDLQICGFIRT